MQHYKNCVEGIPPHLIPDRPYTHYTHLQESAHTYIYVAKVLCVHKDICVVVLMLRNSHCIYMVKMLTFRVIYVLIILSLCLE